MKLLDVVELPVLKDDSKENLETLLSAMRLNNKKNSDLWEKFRIKEFFELIDSDGITTILKRGNAFIVIKKKIESNGVSELKMVNQNKMVFQDTKELPKTNKGKSGENWLDVFNQIPVGKMWVTSSKEHNASTIRQGLKKLVDTKAIKADEFSVTQREGKDETIIYVIHNAPKKV